jgi:hypothetical protein
MYHNNRAYKESKFKFFPESFHPTLTYLIKSMLLVNVFMFLYSIYYETRVLSSHYSHFERDLIQGFIELALSSIFIYCYYYNIRLRRGLYILFFYSARSIIILYPSHNVPFGKLALITIILLFAVISCLFSCELSKFTGYFIIFLFLLIIISLVLSFAVRIRFSISGNYSFLITTLGIGKFLQVATKRSITIKHFSKFWIRFGGSVFFASFIVSVISLCSWLPI